MGACRPRGTWSSSAVPGTNTVVADFTFGPNSSTGWHTHPGKTLVTVKSRTFTVYHAKDCAPNVYQPGDAFVELPSSVHIGRNETSGTVELGVVFFGVPIGGSPRISQPHQRAVRSLRHEGQLICGFGRPTRPSPRHGYWCFMVHA